MKVGSRLFDFDGCLHSWYVNDIAIVLFYAVSGVSGDMNRESFARDFMQHFMPGYLEENHLDDAWLSQIPHFLKLRELDTYGLIHANMHAGIEDDPWATWFLEDRKRRIENDVPYLDIELRERTVSLQRTTRYQGAIIRDHHILLIMHREPGSESGYWVIPGGGREGNESEEDCVRREMLEETHLTVRVERLLIEELSLPKGIYRQRKTYLCTPVAGEAKPGHEPEFAADEGYDIVSVGWFDLRDESGWHPELLANPITYPQVQRVREILGYR